MASLEEVHARIKEKQKERRELQRMFKDELAHDARYQEIAEEMRKLREEKKSIENRAYAMASKDAEKLDLLQLDIKSDRELLSDQALDRYAKGETVEIVDQFNMRWVPKFSVSFVKDAEVEAERPSVELAGGALKIPRISP